MVAKLPKKLCRFFLSLSLLLFPAFYSAVAFSLPDKLSELEIKAWTEHDEFLSELENEVVRVIQLQPSSAYAHYILSHIFIRKFSLQPLQEEFAKKALELAQQALELDPQTEFGYVALSHVFEALGLRDNAKEILNSAPTESWRLKFSKISLALSMGKESNTLSELETLANVYPESRGLILPFLLGLMADSLEGVSLQDALIRIEETTHSSLASQALALRFIETQEYDKTEAIYVKLLTAPNNPEPELRINYGIFLSRFKEQDEKAETLLRQALQDRVPDVVKSIIHSQLGVIAVKRNQVDLASREFIQALHLSSDKTNTLKVAVNAFVSLKKIDRLQEFCDVVNSEFPGNAAFYAILGQVYSEELKLHTRAIDSYKKAIVLEPRNSAYYNAVGLSFYHLEDFLNALDFFDQAIQLDPTDAVALYNKACIYSLSGFQQLALSHLKKAILIDPSLQDVARHDRDFEKIADLPLFKKLTTQNAGLLENLPVDHAPSPVHKEDKRMTFQ
ncbi:MAG: hypothetical protein HYW48_00895 [Deltaproteobacteria bacterium]|nr:hypothetical protein [Deltaproteobacteria bacterium]